MNRVETLPSRLLTRAAAQAHRLVAGRLATVGARGYHYRLLAALADGGPSNQAVLGRRAGLHLSDVTTTLDELAARHLVERAPDPDDGRRKVVSLTVAGRVHLARLEQDVRAVQDELLAPLTSAERAELCRLLGLLVAHHDPAPGS